MSRVEERALVQIARRQGGLLTPGDLIRITGRNDEARRRVRSGRWQVVLPGVLAPATLELNKALVASAALLWEPTSLLSHHEAASREGIWVPDPEHLRVTVPFTSKKRSVKNLEVVRTRVMPSHMRTDGFHRWTPVDRTVVDLGMVLTRKQLEAVLLSAIRLRKTSAAHVDRVADQLPGRAGLADVRAVTRLWLPERESLLEDVLHGDLLAAIPDEVSRQHTVTDAAGRLIARIDAALVNLRLAFEADGLFFHSTDEQIAADQARDRRLLGLGWQTVRFREDALTERSAVRREIAEIVARRRHDLRAA
jgi:very-short-patch-repair endonuclease